MLRLIDGKIQNEDSPALSALKMRLRDDYVVDCNAGVGRWNKVIEQIGIPFQMKLPHVAFHRHIGELASRPTSRRARRCGMGKTPRRISAFGL
ncbi:MAG: hypothetical protein WCE27_09205 [Pseudolabrys sp.]